MDAKVWITLAGLSCLLALAVLFAMLPGDGAVWPLTAVALGVPLIVIAFVGRDPGCVCAAKTKPRGLAAPFLRIVRP